MWSLDWQRFFVRWQNLHRFTNIFRLRSPGVSRWGTYTHIKILLRNISVELSSLVPKFTPRNHQIILAIRRFSLFLVKCIESLNVTPKIPFIIDSPHSRSCKETQVDLFGFLHPQIEELGSVDGESFFSSAYLCVPLRESFLLRFFWNMYPSYCQVVLMSDVFPILFDTR